MGRLGRNRNVSVSVVVAIWLVGVLGRIGLLVQILVEVVIEQRNILTVDVVVVVALVVLFVLAAISFDSVSTGLHSKSKLGGRGPEERGPFPLHLATITFNRKRDHAADFASLWIGHILDSERLGQIALASLHRA